MKHFIIDGNNLIGKINSLLRLQKKDRQQSRVKLAFLIDNYFQSRNAKVTIHFDGHEQEPIKLINSKITYSQNISADEKIKREIELGKNAKNIIVVTSDNNLSEFAKVCSCTVIKSEEFADNVHNKNNDDEADRIKGMSNDVNEFKRLFGVDEN
jgi:predicted RNA-binding protein with PIN domain